MKKRTIANLIMAGIIFIIMAAGVLGVGSIRGWFDRTDDAQAILTSIQGTVNMQRDGIIYPIENDTVLRTGDKLLCNPGAAADVQIGSSRLTIGQNAEIEITDPSAENFTADVSAGEVFAAVTDPVTLSFDNKEISLTETTVHLSVRSGAQSISVFAGAVGEASAGQQLCWVGDILSVRELSIESLNDFTISQIRTANKSQTLFFTDEDLDALAAARQAAIQELLNSAGTAAEETIEASGEDISETAETETESTLDGSETAPSSSEAVTASSAAAESSTATEAATEAPTDAPVTEAPTTAAATEAPTDSPAAEAPTTTAVTEAPTTVPATEAPTTAAPTTAAPTEPPATEPPAPAKSICTITIRCDTILENMDELDPAKVEFVPSDGVILYPVTVEFDEGETVFDVLQRVCNTAGIQLEFSWTPMYNSYYIEGINHLYEFDCGSESGWMYKVNGWFPNYGCSSYTLADGDTIEWLYTCHGLGTDVGAPAQ